MRPACAALVNHTPCRRLFLLLQTEDIKHFVNTWLLSGKKTGGSESTGGKGVAA